ncbi:sigma 54-interacting transcriptional regulator [Bacillus alveayuensis]|uniref:sigma 54-interacting transcriptional regulator n=1 Tax=Aeribacillus alveayuensis TaxID=279215 RepID=UPI0005CDBA9A|nr:sigma 54-interacting transcriptional regulator [Bacillus alveayuensis]
MIIEEVMTRTAVKFYESDLIAEASRTLVENDMEGGVVYNDQGDVTGVFSKKEILFGLQRNKTYVKEIMVSSFHLLNEKTEIEKVDFGAAPLNPVIDEHGKIIGYMTKEQYLEAYAKETHIRLKHLDAIFNSAHNGILSIDASGRITSINPSAEKMARTTKEKAIGQFLTDVVVPSGLLGVIQTGKGHTEKYRVGKRIYITSRSPIMDGDRVVGAVGVFQDISEIEFISNELETVKQIVDELNTIIDTSNDGICVIDDKCNIVKMNEKFSGLFQLSNNSYYNIFDISEDIGKLVSEVIRNKKPYSVLKKDRKTNNSLIISATPITDGQKNVNKIVINVKDMTEMEMLRDELEKTKKMLNTLSNRKENSFIYRSPMMKNLMKMVHQVAGVDVTVLLKGESGVGKEEIANYIWRYSQRKNKPFVKVNCGAIPETLIESELFGYEPGAFTGASKKGKKGYFEQADGGIIFLDEIGEIPQHLQVKLLRVLQEMEITRIGAEKTKKIDVRVIAATNKDLEEMVSKGKFREDLFYRLNVVPIMVPPLRKRKEDIPLLIDYYANVFSSKYDKEIVFSNGAIQAFLNYHWPGNVRELVNVIERIFVTSTSVEVSEDYIIKLLNLEQSVLTSEHVTVHTIVPLKMAVEEVEKQLILKALQKEKTYRKAAKLLQVNASTIVRKIQKYEKGI